MLKSTLTQMDVSSDIKEMAALVVKQLVQFFNKKMGSDTTNHWR